MEQADIAPGTGKNSQKWEWARRTGIVIKRTLAIAAVFAAVYLIIGSYFYGDWWFGLLWDHKIFDSQYIANGFLYLFDNHFVLTVTTILGLFVISSVAVIFKTQVMRFLDRLWLWIVMGSLVAISVTGLCVYHNFKDTYVDAFSDDFYARFRAQMEALVPEVTKPKLLPPIDFKFLDQSRTEALYSEILPDLIEEERSIETDSKKGIKGNASLGTIGGEISLEKGTQIKSGFHRPDFSPSRKCIELMNFAIQSGRAHVYYTDSIWLISRRNRDIVDDLEKLRNAPIEDVLKRLHPIPEVGKSQEIEEARQKEKQFAAELRNELLSAKGLVYVEGEFKFSGTTADQQIIVHQFADKPQPNRFEITLPSSAHADQMFSGRKVWMRVFASVDRALDQNGVVAMHAIAVF